MQLYNKIVIFLDFAIKCRICMFHYYQSTKLYNNSAFSQSVYKKALRCVPSSHEDLILQTRQSWSYNNQSLSEDFCQNRGPVFTRK